VTGSRARDIARRSLGAFTVTALCGAAVVVGTGVTTPGSAAAPLTNKPASAVPTPAAQQTPATRTIAPRPRGSSNPTPQGTATAGKPGIAITAHPEADGSFLVSEVITLPAATTEVALRPPSIADAGIGFERRQPRAINVQLSAGGQAPTVPDGPVRSEMTMRWDSPTQQLQLSYRLADVSVANATRPGLGPSARAGAGRRTVAALGSLLGGMPADLPVTVLVTGKTVLSLSCPQLPLARMACGAGAVPQFRTLHPIPFDRSRVLVQYDRPARP
jgi:hypothetical protein